MHVNGNSIPSPMKPRALLRLPHGLDAKLLSLRQSHGNETTHLLLVRYVSGARVPPSQPTRT
jgi:hypothetical protein